MIGIGQGLQLLLLILGGEYPLEIAPPDARLRGVARGRGGDGRRAEVAVCAIAAVWSQLTMTPWTLTAGSVM